MAKKNIQNPVSFLDVDHFDGNLEGTMKNGEQHADHSLELGGNKPNKAE